jgi:hypothetical protein
VATSKLLFLRYVTNDKADSTTFFLFLRQVLNTFYPVIVETNPTLNRPGNGASDDDEYLEESTAYEICL